MAKNLFKIIALSTLLLTGCANITNKTEKIKEEKKVEYVNYFDEVLMNSYESSLTMTSGDFDGDGDLDLIVGSNTHDWNSKLGSYTGKLFFYEGDGKGNFTKRQYPVKK
jgi:hypothetical protein